MKIFNTNDLANMDTRYRAAFMNSLGGFKSVVLIGTQNAQGQSNLAIFNSLVHLGANPPLCGIVVRPDVSRRHTLENILETKQYTINHLNEDIYIQAHQTSARFLELESEFEMVNFTPQYVPNIHPPFVAQSEVKFACEFKQRIDLEINGTSLIIGEIIHVSMPNDILCSDGYIDIEKAGSVAGSGLDSYHLTQRLARLTYAKPNTWPVKLSHEN